jgi:hypothetical protein
LLTSSGWRDDQEEELHRLVVDGLEIETARLAAERDTEAVHHEGAAVRNRNAAADPGGAEVLSALEHLEEHPLGLVIELEEGDEFLEDLIFGGAFELELDGVFGEEFTEFHSLQC